MAINHNEMEEFDIQYYEEHFKDGGCRLELDGLMTIMSEIDDRYIVQIEPPFPDMVCTMKHYYPDTLTLMTVGHYLKEGNCRIGVWTTYDRLGEVTEETDYEQNWNVSWEALLPVLVAEKINFKSIVGIDRCILNEEKNETEDIQGHEGEENPDGDEAKEESSVEVGKPDEMTEDEDEENEWLDEEELAEFGKELEDADNTPVDKEEQPKPKPKPVKCWIVTTVLSPRVMIDHYYSGDTGEKLCENYNIMK